MSKYTKTQLKEQSNQKHFLKKVNFFNVSYTWQNTIAAVKTITKATVNCFFLLKLVWTYKDIYEGYPVGLKWREGGLFILFRKVTGGRNMGKKLNKKTTKRKY